MKTKEGALSLVEIMIIVAIFMLIASLLLLSRGIKRDIQTASDHIAENGVKGIASEIWHGTNGPASKTENE